MSPNNTAAGNSSGSASSNNRGKDVDVPTQSDGSSSRSANSSPSKSASSISLFDSSQTTQCSSASAHGNASEVNDQEFYWAIFGPDALRPPPSRIGSPSSSRGSVLPTTSSRSSKDSPPSPGEGPSTIQKSADTTSGNPLAELQTLFDTYGREVYFRNCDELLVFTKPHTFTSKSIKGKEIRQPIEDFEDVLLRYSWEGFWHYYGRVEDVNLSFDLREIVILFHYIVNLAPALFLKRRVAMNLHRDQYPRIYTAIYI
ncbi:hypothetical protein BDZ45DRAFT_785647 [Acephala macrosclerotiorum]|nr:hypothetical protein BDZ45DRAFT_785647 [Acephala macrosclerotiorum]